MDLFAAMGLQALSTYVFWNLHEPVPGEYVFDGRADVAAYVRTAAEAGLAVVLRPGPYICAEWEFGGLPAWLLSGADLGIRTRSAAYLAHVRRWLRRLGRELAPLQRAYGGPIIAVQVENEYGAFGRDPGYLAAVRAVLDESGFSASPYYTIDQPRDLGAGSCDNLPAAVTFAPGDARDAFAALQAFRPGAPLLCGEYWAGWFDHWGEPHAVRDVALQVNDFTWMLKQQAGINIYMLHGGTNTGFWNGANHDERGAYAATTTSYDYLAAIDEAGRPRETFYRFREAIEQHTARPLPAPRAPAETIAIPPFELRASAPLAHAVERTLHAAHPLAMERLGGSRGYVRYRALLPGPRDAVLRIAGLHDYALLLLEGALVCAVDSPCVEMPLRLPESAFLEVLVENSGRVNYGAGLPFERKGIVHGVWWADTAVCDWEIDLLPMIRMEGLGFADEMLPAPAFYRGTFEIERTADTFLDVGNLGKGSLWVNGRHAGRFWRTGPQRSLYVPSVWLTRGRNEVTVFDLLHCGGRLRGTREPLSE